MYNISMKKLFLKCIILSLFLSLPAKCDDNFEKQKLNNLRMKSKNVQAIVPEPTNTLKLRDDAIAFYNLNDIKNAQTLLNQIPNHQRNAFDYLLLANIEQDLGNETESISYLKKAITIDKNFYKAYYNLGNIYLANGENQTAISYYKKAILKNKDFAYGYYNLGICYARMQNFKTSKSYFNRAILRKRDVPDFYYNLAFVYKKLGDEKNAQKALTVYNNLINR